MLVSFEPGTLWFLLRWLNPYRLLSLHWLSGKWINSELLTDQKLLLIPTLEWKYNGIKTERLTLQLVSFIQPIFFSKLEYQHTFPLSKSSQFSKLMLQTKVIDPFLISTFGRKILKRFCKRNCHQEFSHF